MKLPENKHITKCFSTREIAERVEAWGELSDSGLRLRCGELTAQEIRTVRAVLNAILANTQGDTRPPTSKPEPEPVADWFGSGVWTAADLLDFAYRSDIERWWEAWKDGKHHQFVRVRLDTQKQEYFLDAVGQDLRLSEELWRYKHGGWTFRSALPSCRAGVVEENERMRAAPLHMANMPEYDQDDAHRLRHQAKLALPNASHQP